MSKLVVLGKVALRLLAAVVIGLITYPIVLGAFHPWEGLIDGYLRTIPPERYFALAFSIAVFLATLWRLLCGSTMRDEMKRLNDSLTGDTEA